MTTIAVLRVLASMLIDGCLSLACGLLLADLWLGRAHPIERRPAYRPNASLLTLVAGVFLVAAMANLLLLTADFSGATSLGSLLAALPDTLSTHAGTIACAIVVATSLLLASSLPSLRRSRGTALPSIALLFCLLLRSATGHAATDGDFSLAQLLQATHLIAMSLWSGGVLVSGLLVVPRLAPLQRSTPDPSSGADAVFLYLSSLSTVSTWAVLAVFLSGLLKSYRSVGGDLHLLPAILWGKLLFLKLALVSIALLLGALNRMSLRSSTLWNSRTISRSVRTLHLEAWTMTAILLLSAVLASVPPPGE